MSPIALFRNRRAAAGIGPLHQLNRAARGSAGICHFNFPSNFHEYVFYSGNIVRKKIFLDCVEKLRPRCWPEETTKYYNISFVQWLITNLNVILYLSTFQTVYINCKVFMSKSVWYRALVLWKRNLPVRCLTKA